MATVVIPADKANANGNAQNIIPFGATVSQRAQFLYLKTGIPQAGYITAIGFRLGDSQETVEDASFDIQINCAYTSNFASPSTTFADNIASNLTTCLNSNNYVLDLIEGTPGPFFVFNFTTPFYYDPAVNDLLVEVLKRNTNGLATLDYQSFASDFPYKRVFTNSITGDYTNTTGTTDGGSQSAPITQFTMIFGDINPSLPVRLGHPVLMGNMTSNRVVRLRLS